MNEYAGCFACRQIQEFLLISPPLRDSSPSPFDLSHSPFSDLTGDYVLRFGRRPTNGRENSPPAQKSDDIVKLPACFVFPSPRFSPRATMLNVIIDWRPLNRAIKIRAHLSCGVGRNLITLLNKLQHPVKIIGPNRSPSFSSESPWARYASAESQSDASAIKMVSVLYRPKNNLIPVCDVASADSTGAPTRQYAAKSSAISFPN